MKNRYWLGLALVVGCSGERGGDTTESMSTIGGTLGTEGTTTATGDGTVGDPTGPTGGGSGGSDSNDTTPPETKWDVADQETFCVDKAAGTYCNGSTAVVCDGEGMVESDTICDPDYCLDDMGCVVCLDGLFACFGPRVMQCDTSVSPHQWQEIAVCDPAADMACDLSVGACVPLAPIGTTNPTGVYYQFSYHIVTPDGAFNTVSDVDTWGNRLYFVANLGAQVVVGVYDITLQDSDGDGVMEPNQHPDNPDATGPVEDREFTFIESFPITAAGGFPNVMELHARATKLLFTGPAVGITEYDLATGVETQVALPAPWLSATGYSSLSFLGYDEINDIYYSGNEVARRVMQYDNETMTWGWAFEFPQLAGSHMDGLEVVVDPNTQIPYMYVSDMTSNFIGQYRLDPVMGWVQDNLFTYNEPTGALVEGFGYGALSHFWVGDYSTGFYELGGGDLAEFTGPEG